MKIRCVASLAEQPIKVTNKNWWKHTLLYPLLLLTLQTEWGRGDGLVLEEITLPEAMKQQQENVFAGDDG